MFLEFLSKLSKWKLKLKIKTQNSASSSSSSASLGLNNDSLGIVNYARTSASANVFHITINKDSNFICNGKFILYSNGNYSL